MAKKPQPLQFPNPVNSNQSLDAEHTIYVAGTGGGRTSAVKHLGLIPPKGRNIGYPSFPNFNFPRFIKPNLGCPP
ncbi:hypothetical protein Vspart_01677 [Vibrio spartinae]|uniref:Uncharacterized protein n=1 Tax=Vibrio spartinae TaxID=1918945 RepID=A0A1N6M385_9VIBR|nr:hypothetical protein Vspart_01677 [Vibrio spartinae]SIO93901.1 hypothetical protein VSP9026_01580 [Vibrio spartinae]